MPRSLLGLALLCHLLLAGSYALLTPGFEGPDENSHYEYAQHLANAGKLPLARSLANARGLPQSDSAVLAHHPPLYYALLAGVLLATGRDDTVFGPRLNPGFGDPASASRHLRFQHGSGEGEGTLRLLRMVSVLLGAVTIVLVHRLGRVACPARPRVADLAALLVGCLPMWSFLHGVLNSDVLATTLATATSLVLLRLHLAPRVGVRQALGLGTLLGLALLTKLTTLFLVALAAIVLLGRGWRAWRSEASAAGAPGRSSWLFAGVTAGVTAALAGGWFGRNALLYGDPLALSVHDAAFQPIPPELRWHWFFGSDPWPASVPSFLPTVFTSLAGQFGWFSLPPAPAMVWLLVGTAGLGLGGLGWAWLARDRDALPRGMVLLLLAAALVFAGTAHFNWKAPQPQARLLFPAVGPAAVLLAAGLAKLACGLPALRWGAVGLPLCGLVVLLAWFRPAFRPELAPAPAWHRALVGGIAIDPASPTIEWLAPPPATTVTRLDQPPTLRWRDAAAEATTRYTLYVTDPHGRVHLASHEWSHGDVVLQGGEATLPAALWQFVPRGVPLYLQLRVVPASADAPPRAQRCSARLPIQRA
jgi:4-amino-4-deoxy-L-arabinose transferase-like glycosyltransferase